MNKEALAKKLTEIGSLLKTKYKSNEQIGVLEGISGIALFYFYYGKYLKSNEHEETGIEILEETVRRINDGYQFPTYCVGLAGAAWVLDHLLEEGFIDNDNDLLLTGLDAPLFGVMQGDMKKGSFDFLHNGIGYGYYFLKRFKNTNKQELKERYSKYLKQFLVYLEAMAIPGPNCLKWEATVDYQTKLKGYNLSLSHGMSGIVVFLTKLWIIEDLKEAIIPILRKALNYILKCEFDNKTLNSLYPSYVSVSSDTSKESRLAWCYGDLGIGLAYWRASKVLEDKALNSKALQIMEHAAVRRASEKTGVLDAGVCHGSFGNALFFSRFYEETGLSLFKNATTYWMNDGLNKGFHNDGFAGYKQWTGKDETWQAELSLLSGVAGIGLTIISHLGDFGSSWDECLMLS